MDESLSVKIPLNEEELGVYLSRMCHKSAAIVRSDGSFLSCNEIFLHLTGYQFSDMKKLNFYDLIDERLNFDELARQLGGSQKVDQLPRLNIKTKSGSWHSTPVSAFKINRSDRSDKDDTFFIIFFHDLHHTPNSTLFQKFSSSFLKDINLGVILLNNHFQVVEISQTACKILELERTNVLNRPLDEIFASTPLEYQFVERSILNGAVVRNYAFSWTTSSQRYELLLDASIIRDERNEIVGAYILFKDVSNLRSLEEQVQRSDRLAMIGQIAAGTAHEIRNPLTSIKGFLQVLKKRLIETGLEREFEYTELMLIEINRINDLVSEFLMLSKPKELHLKPIEISTVIKEILPIINNEALLHNIMVKYEPEQNIPKVVADKELLKQVCINICKNGIEAMGENGTLTIREKIDSEQSKVLIDIHDSGPGIPSFLIDKIFDPFFSTKEEGTGLGLSVCQRIIHDIRGSIRVKSKGFGTTFTIFLPFE